MRWLVTGAAGQLGAAIAHRLRAGGHTVVQTTRRELDLTRHAAVMEVVEAAGPEVIVNCAAYNDVDGAEECPRDALDVNAFAVRSLARAAHERGATLVHYSTDFVFDGAADRPYTEADRPRPESVYAMSKYLGERFAADAARHFVLRVESLFGGPAGRSSIDRIASSLREGREAPVFVDRVVSPSYVEDVADATERLVAAGAPFGLYHCVNAGSCTWFGVGEELARLLGADPGLLRPVRVAEVPLKAKRPQFAALSNGKLAAAGIGMPTWQDAVARHVGRDLTGRNP
jgi:dTDP-4-dehydrorhamnose reductase